MKIAIDGPAGAGKSTVAKRIAEHLDYLYVDTGAMYRAITFKALQENINLTNEEALLQLLEDLQLEFKREQGEQKILLNGEDITTKIRNEEVSRQVPVVAGHPQVREVLVTRQQEMAAQGGVVMDGRDIGTQVLPDAEVKIYLTASLEERARRRYAELRAKGSPVSLEEVRRELAHRDEQDMNRKVSPLKKAEDAVLVDTTGLEIDQVVHKIIAMIERRKMEELPNR